MNNLDRIKIETKGINYPDVELSIYLQENGLIPDDEYNPQSNANKRAIFQTSLSLLESLANQPQLMKSYKMDDMTISDLSESLQSRIDKLERKIRMMSVSDTETNQTNTFILFNS